jgi:hypothetical protein
MSALDQQPGGNHSAERMAKLQFEYDTLLVVAWRKFWWMKVIWGKLFDLGYTSEEIFSLARISEHWSARTPARAFISQSSADLFRLLDCAKSTSDFVSARNRMNKGEFRFKRALKADGRGISEARKSIRADELQSSAQLNQINARRDYSRKLGAGTKARRGAGL